MSALKTLTYIITTIPTHHIRLCYTGYDVRLDLHSSRYSISSDLFVIIVWDGFKAIDFKTLEKSGGKDIVDIILQFKNKYGVAESNIVYDSDGVGAFIGGDGGFITGAKAFVNGGKALKEKGKAQNYENLKTQCIYNFSNRVVFKGYDLTKLIERKDYVIEELEAVSRRDSDKEGRLKVIIKKDIKQLIGRSPDFLDCLMMREFFELDRGSSLPRFV